MSHQMVLLDSSQRESSLRVTARPDQAISRDVNS
jgi:hypothetical protein